MLDIKQHVKFFLVNLQNKNAYLMTESLLALLVLTICLSLIIPSLIIQVDKLRECQTNTGHFRQASLNTLSQTGSSEAVTVTLEKGGQPVEEVISFIE
ncbi:hypothetical protein AWM75_02155 [Aerococcus urinaehominis]|uniref:Uncharacterized protein n=1 Tax=Aerococcus urinaehominis TaxID=128944 RepID=A0A0X8FK92_9LACT|nr:hypothetical protein [Aerococcus urinaehominis]AMB98866.1 hypothetical protein AWM75_02155 [Aerococcus urinaehominis]SDM16704.1 hypothetical protein SAMN04487985_10735 [Aerococcus urinaehominis]